MDYSMSIANINFVPSLSQVCPKLKGSMFKSPQADKVGLGQKNLIFSFTLDTSDFTFHTAKHNLSLVPLVPVMPRRRTDVNPFVY